MPITLVTVAADNTSHANRAVEVRYNTADDNGRITGYIEVHSVCRQYSSSYEFEAEVYYWPSLFGINEGRIGKLCVRDVNSDNATEVIKYDREWCLKPYCPEERAALEALLTIFDTPQFGHNQ